MECSSRNLQILIIGLLIAVLVGTASAQDPPVAFKNVTEATGLKIGTDAACWADLDNDGWSDLCASGGVWKNNEGKTFTRVADVPTSVAADFDNDGFVDLFSWTARKLYRNDGKMGFAEVKLPELPPETHHPG